MMTDTTDQDQVLLALAQRLREEPPIPPAKTLTEAVVALAAAARQSTMDDAGTAFIVQHLKRTLDHVQRLEDELARLRRTAGASVHI
jgi:hypothetical protein